MWKDLSMLERAALIKLGVDNGVYDIDEIKSSYNQYKNGGYKPSSTIKKKNIRLGRSLNEDQQKL